MHLYKTKMSQIMNVNKTNINDNNQKLQNIINQKLTFMKNQYKQYRSKQLCKMAVGKKRRTVR